MWTRLKRLWALSDLEPHLIIKEFKESGIHLIPSGIDIKNVHQQAKFIPRIKEKPIDKIIKIGEES